MDDKCTKHFLDFGKYTFISIASHRLTESYGKLESPKKQMLSEKTMHFDVSDFN